MQELKLLDEKENGISDKIQDVRYGIMYNTYEDVLKKIEAEKQFCMVGELTKHIDKIR